VEELGTGSEGFSTRMSLVFGLSIPVIVRQGELALGLAVRDLALDASGREGGSARISLVLERRGGRSAYGDLVATLYPGPPGGDPVALGRRLGVAIYPPLEERRLSLPLYVPADVELSGGTLRVTFEERSSGADEPPPRAEGELLLP
jgi:hypothetical protein